MHPTYPNPTYHISTLTVATMEYNFRVAPKRHSSYALRGRKAVTRGVQESGPPPPPKFSKVETF
jgi:hypothetical protein